MAQNTPPQNNTDKPKGRLDNPRLRFLSILVGIAAIGIFLYSFTSNFPIIPVMTGIFFLMLWFIPQFWKWIEWAFSKRPSSAWGRFTLNLILAIIMASAFEDILEIVQRFARIIFWMLSKVL